MRRLEWAFDRLTRLSKTDSLTGLANRRHFEQVLEAFYHQARRYHRPLSVIAVDVDFFKAVNDTGGHSAGDQVLKQLAAAIVLAGRKADIPARLGGDEFAVLLPETSAADAQAVAERIAAAVRDLKGPVSLPGQGITISAGVADLDSAPIDSPEALLALSDRALYAAKEAGRNRIVQAHDLTGALPAGTAACGRQADRDSQKVVALDGQFKQLFLRAVEEIVAAFEQRSPRLAGHARQVQHDALLIGGKMNLSPRVLERLRVAATLHDIGKIGMADRVLGAPADLGPETLADLRQHPVLSARIMEGMRFLEDEVPAVRHHHERYDGSGYPDGLAGEAIPIEARILAVADAFALITSGEGGAGVSEAFAEIRTGSGTHFDPAVVEALAATLEPAAAVTGSLAGAGLKPER